MERKLLKAISILVVLTTMLVSLISCQYGHRDADDNTACDKCGATYTDGKLFYSEIFTTLMKRTERYGC